MIGGPCGFGYFKGTSDMKHISDFLPFVYTRDE